MADRAPFRSELDGVPLQFRMFGLAPEPMKPVGEGGMMAGNRGSALRTVLSRQLKKARVKDARLKDDRGVLWFAEAELARLAGRELDNLYQYGNRGQPRFPGDVRTMCRHGQLVSRTWFETSEGIRTDRIDKTDPKLVLYRLPTAEEREDNYVSLRAKDAVAAARRRWRQAKKNPAHFDAQKVRRDFLAAHGGRLRTAWREAFRAAS